MRYERLSEAGKGRNPSIHSQNRRKLTRQERQTVYDKMGGRCAYCGRELQYADMQVDHVVPLRKGGPDVLDNMLPACRSCNHYKDTLTVQQFREMVEKMPKVLERDSVTYRNAVRFGLVEPKPHHVVFYFEKLEEINHERECQKAAGLD